MTTQIDDINPGMWLAITGYRDDGYQESYNPVMAAMGMVESSREPPDGNPLRVIAMTLPFVVVEDIDGDRGTMDVREFTFQRLSRSYVDALLGNDKKPTKAKRRVTDKNACPRCRSKMRQRKYAKCDGVTAWLNVCCECGYTRGKV